MLFNTLEFAVFLIPVLLLYYRLGHRGQNRLLLAASLFFYGSWDWRFLGLLLLSTGIDYAAALGIEASADPRRRKRLLALSVGANLTILCTFKYLGFFCDSFADLMELFGFEVPRLAIDVILPVGISFYTFQTMSYTIDVYRGDCSACRNPIDFALFVSFFPQLVAGPIERAPSLLPQITHPRSPTWEQFSTGSWFILWGIFKKVVVADNLAYLVGAVYDPAASPTNLELLITTYAFSFQIYCDFSGYSDIARGLARLMGFELMVNFRLPYFVTNISEFWGRWHISLGRWIRDYVYIPLGGSRLGETRTRINLMIMFVAVGLWHGASWAFVLYGIYFGFLAIAHRALRPTLARIRPKGRIGGALWALLSIALVFNLNAVAGVFFLSDSLAHIGRLFALFLEPPALGLVTAWRIPLACLIAPILLMDLWQSIADDDEVVAKSPAWVRLPLYLVLMAGIVLLGEDQELPYIYFQF